MNVRNHPVLVAGGGACAVLLLFALVFLFRSHSDYRRQTVALETLYHRLAELNTRNPFPSSGNEVQMEKNLGQIEFHVGELAARLARDPFPLDAVEAADFSARAQGVIERFQKRADGAGIVLPDRLEVGFAQYASGGAVPAAEDVPRLTRQLYSVERVADVLARSGVHSIEMLSRDLFESESDPVPEMRDRRRGRRNASISVPMRSIREVASVVHPEGLYYIERIGVGFTAREDGVWRVLDLFASAPHFMVVTSYSHVTQTKILSYNPEAVKRGGEGIDETLKFLSTGVLAGSTALSRPERLIAGNELIHVSLVVEVYNFEPLAEGGATP